MRIVLDTSSLITALRSSAGAAAEVLRLVFAGRVVLLMDLKVISEYRDVALRPSQLASVARAADEVGFLIDALEQLAQPVEVFFKPRPLSVDPNDDMVLDLAINGRADAIVTQNQRHFTAAASPYGIAVLTPAQVLSELRSEV